MDESMRPGCPRLGREAEAHDTDRLLERRREELELLKKQCAELEVRYQQLNSSPEHEAKDREIEALREECVRLTEAEQASEIARLVDESMANNIASADADDGSGEDLDLKLQLLRRR